MNSEFDQENILDKMRQLRDQRDIEILNEPISGKAQKVLNVKFLGQVDGIGDVYLVIEQEKDQNGNLFQVERYETEEGEVIGGNNKSDAYDFILLSEKYKDKGDLLEQLQQLHKEGIFGLNEMEQNRLEAVAKELGVSTKDLKRVTEIEADKEIETKNEKDSKDQEIENEEQDTLSAEEVQSVSSKTEIDVNQKVTDSETMASLLKVQDKGYKKFVVVESDTLQETNSTRFSFVGIKEVERNGRKVEVAEKIDTLDQRYGQSPSKGIERLNSDGSELERKQMQSIYHVRGDNENQIGVNIGSAGNLEVSYIRTPRQNNAEAISILIETRSVRPTTSEVRKFMNKNLNPDLTKEIKRIQQHREAGCEEINMRNIDNDETNDDHSHNAHEGFIKISDEYVNQLVDMIFKRYEDLGNIYNRGDVKAKIEEVIKEKGQIPEKEELIEEVGTQLEESAKGEHELPRNRIRKGFRKHYCKSKSLFC